MTPCECTTPHPRRRVVLTGGPGAGKTAVLALVRQSFCEHIKVLPESASVVFGGGFPRSERLGSRQAAQRAIFYVQRELEAAIEAENPAITLCDRGTVDGAAYCDDPADFWQSMGTTLEEQLARYDVVIHLRTPPAEQGYNHLSEPRPPRTPPRSTRESLPSGHDTRTCTSLGIPRTFWIKPLAFWTS